MEDILNWRPEWPEKLAEDFMLKYGGHIADAAIDAGQVAIVNYLEQFEQLIAWQTKNRNGDNDDRSSDAVG